MLLRCNVQRSARTVHGSSGKALPLRRSESLGAAGMLLASMLCKLFGIARAEASAHRRPYCGTLREAKHADTAVQHTHIAPVNSQHDHQRSSAEFAQLV